MTIEDTAMTETICPTCDGGPYKQIGQHWAQSCEAPAFTGNQQEIIDGMMVGDPYVRYDRSGSLRFSTTFDNRETAEDFSEVFGVHTTPIREVNGHYEVSLRSTTVLQDYLEGRWVDAEDSEQGSVSFVNRLPSDLSFTPLFGQSWLLSNGQVGKTENPDGLDVIDTVYFRTEHFENDTDLLANLIGTAGFDVWDLQEGIAVLPPRTLFRWLGMLNREAEDHFGGMLVQESPRQRVRFAVRRAFKVGDSSELVDLLTEMCVDLSGLQGTDWAPDNQMAELESGTESESETQVESQD